jgi:hypothetical protein
MMVSISLGWVVADKVGSRVIATSSTPSCSRRAIIACSAAPSARTPRSSVSVTGSTGVRGSSAARMVGLSRPRTRKVYSLLMLASRSWEATSLW